MTGRQIGHLTVTGRDDPPLKANGAMWRCQCVCGNAVAASGANLRSGRMNSCGCVWLKKITKHGKSRDASHRLWMQMLRRCDNPNNKGYRHYGGRGIKVCERWLSYENFLADMGERPDPSLSIERVDVNGDYCPENCVWATATTQSRNRRTTKLTVEAARLICEARGRETQAVTARRFGITNSMVCYIQKGKSWKEVSQEAPHEDH